MKFKTPYNAETFPQRRESHLRASQTIPEQHMTVRELITRHTRGLPISGSKVPIYDEEDDILPDFSKMDLAEIEEFRFHAENELVSIATKSRQKAAAKKEILERKEKEKQQRESDSLQSKPNQGTSVLETDPTDVKSRKKS